MRKNTRICFLRRMGEVFDLDGKKAIVMGGAYSVDKMIRLMYGYGWWPDEQPSEKIKRGVERKLDELGWKVDVVLSHTTPLKYEPVEVFLEGIDQSYEPIFLRLYYHGWISC